MSNGYRVTRQRDGRWRVAVSRRVSLTAPTLDRAREIAAPETPAPDRPAQADGEELATMTSDTPTTEPDRDAGPVVTIYHVTMPSGEPDILELLPFAQEGNVRRIEEFNAAHGLPAGTRWEGLRTETRPCTPDEIAYDAYVRASDASRRPEGSLSSYSFHRLDWPDWVKAGKPTSDDNLAAVSP